MALLLRWPPVLRRCVRGGAELALSALGGVTWWLKRGLVDVELASGKHVWHVRDNWGRFERRTGMAKAARS